MSRPLSARALLRREVKRRARETERALLERRRLVEQLSAPWEYTSEDEPRPPCAWCGGDVRWREGALCDACDALSRGLGTRNAHTRRACRLAWRARKGEIDLATYSAVSLAWSRRG